jgi:RNA polymerase-binding transcription factor DksA
MAKKPKKPAPASKKKPVGKPVKPAAKKSPTKPVKKSPSKPPVKKPAARPAPKPAHKPASKPSPKAAAKSRHSHAAKPAPKSAAPVKSDKSKSSPPAKAEKPAAKPAAAPIVVPKSASKAAVTAKSSARADLRSRILQKKGPIRPIAFSLDEIREIAKTAKVDTEAKGTTAKVTAKTTKQIDAAKLAQASQPHHIKAASLADILGFNPRKAQQPLHDDSEDIPEKFRRYYKLLIELRNHLTGQIDTHSEETLKRSSKDDAGDLSSYGQHMADAGTDTFDRDFALSLVSSEQEALSEVEAAIKRIKDGSYGTCEITQKPIAKERLLAVPFTRYSAEAQKNIERNRHRSRTQAGLFGELGEEGATLGAGGGDDGDE